MSTNKFIENMVDQIKEAQIKLGYAKETVRLYYPTTSVNALLGIDIVDAEELVMQLKSNPSFSNTVLGRIQFAVHGGRIEVSIPPEGAEYVHREVPIPAFLTDIIELFGNHHNCTLKDVCDIFEKYSQNYVCLKMPEEMDFDYVLYFEDEKIDAFYYCIKKEMGHTIYHRFTKEDYQALVE